MIAALLFALMLFAGGKPSKQTPRDQRLKENKPKSPQTRQPPKRGN